MIQRVIRKAVLMVSWPTIRRRLAWLTVLVPMVGLWHIYVFAVTSVYCIREYAWDETKKTMKPWRDIAKAIW